jgi:hypothetical protein
MKYRVVKITKDVDRYPECAADTEEFPQLVKYVDDEMDLFIIDEAGQCVAPASEFFYIHDVPIFFTGD